MAKGTTPARRNNTDRPKNGRDVSDDLAEAIADAIGPRLDDHDARATTLEERVGALEKKEAEDAEALHKEIGDFPIVDPARLRERLAERLGPKKK